MILFEISDLGWVYLSVLLDQNGTSAGFLVFIIPGFVISDIRNIDMKDEFIFQIEADQIWAVRKLSIQIGTEHKNSKAAKAKNPWKRFLACWSHEVDIMIQNLNPEANSHVLVSNILYFFNINPRCLIYDQELHLLRARGSYRKNVDFGRFQPFCQKQWNMDWGRA